MPNTKVIVALSEQEIAEILDPVSMTEPQYPKEAAKHREDIKKQK